MCRNVADAGSDGKMCRGDAWSDKIIDCSSLPVWTAAHEGQVQAVEEEGGAYPLISVCFAFDPSSEKTTKLSEYVACVME